MTKSLWGQDSQVPNFIPGRTRIQVLNVCLMAQKYLDNETVEGGEWYSSIRGNWTQVSCCLFTVQYRRTYGSHRWSKQNNKRYLKPFVFILKIETSKRSQDFYSFWRRYSIYQELKASFFKQCTVGVWISTVLVSLWWRHNEIGEWSSN